jgi:hypothetical protein
MGVLETWYLHAYLGQDGPLVHRDAKISAVARKAMKKAAAHTNTTLLRQIADRQESAGIFEKIRPY